MNIYLFEHLLFSYGENMKDILLLELSFGINSVLPPTITHHKTYSTLLLHQVFFLFTPF